MDFIDSSASTALAAAAADAWLISFGLSRLLTSYGSLSARLAYVPILAVLILDGVILYRFFHRRRIERKASAAQSQHDRAGDRSNV